MRLVRIGVGAVSVKVGDFTGNAARLRVVIEHAREEGVHLLVTPELGISGYSLEDRVFWPDIARHSWATLMELAEACAGISVFVGLPVRLDSMMYNAAAFLHDGRVLGLILKKYLPTYSIFYEMRNWSPWPGGVAEIDGVPAGDLVFRLPYGVVSAEICEDLWSAHSPAWARVAAGAEIICNPSASPFTPRKNEERKRLILGAASSLKAAYAYANLLGCDNSRLVFDGGGFIATPDSIVAEGPVLSWAPWTLAQGVVNLDDIARLRAENTTWRVSISDREEAEDTVEVDASEGTFKPAPLASFVAWLPKSFYWLEPKADDDPADRCLDELYEALALGLRDYFEKVGAFQRFLVALSGGRDSALCLLLAVKAAKGLKGGAEAGHYADHVSAAYLPNEAYSSDATQEAARSLAEELGVPFQVVGIEAEARLALDSAAALAGGEDQVTPLTRQNLQARVRGNMMLNWANSENALSSASCCRARAPANFVSPAQIFSLSFRSSPPLSSALFPLPRKWRRHGKVRPIPARERAPRLP